MSMSAPSRAPVIDTGPLPVLSGTSTTAQSRIQALVALGADLTSGVRYLWETVTMCWNGPRKRVYIAADDEVDPHDWRAMLAALRVTGWLTGHHGYEDIGEPAWDRVTCVWVWLLGCPLRVPAPVPYHGGRHVGRAAKPSLWSPA